MCSDKEDQNARKLAREWAVLLLRPIQPMPIPEHRYTVVDLIGAGAAFLYPVNEGYEGYSLRAANREFLSKVLESVHSPAALEDWLYSQIRQGGLTAGQLQEALQQAARMAKNPAAVRKLLYGAIDDAYPKGEQGRPTEFDPAIDPDRLLSLSARLRPICAEFVELRRRFPKKSSEEIIEFLESEDPGPVALIRRHSNQVAKVEGSPAFQSLNSLETRARRLADIVTGRELFGWSASYSVQRAGQLRRAKGDANEE